MNAKNNRNNSNFQIAYYLVGSCHTADGAYALLCDLKEKQDLALSHAVSAELRLKARLSKARAMLECVKHEWEKMEAQAEICECEHSLDFQKKLVAAAKDELSFIVESMKRIDHLRKYKHLPDPEAHQAAQREEWKLELIYRAENFLLTSGTIPSDHFATMRQHPDYIKEIAPAIQNKLDSMAKTSPAGGFLFVEEKVPLLDILKE